MKSLYKFGLLVMVVILTSSSSEKKAFEIFKESGKKADYEKMLKDISEADIVFFGELHDNSISHWFEIEIAKDLYNLRGNKLKMGAEMYEADGQLLIDELISGKIKFKDFESQARLWPNHKTDYAPILKFAVEKRIPFIATNIPRRYASLVNASGLTALDSLPAESKKFIAPLPIKYDPEVACYKSMLEMMGGHGNAEKMKNLPAAQAVKDATMAHFILSNYNEGDLFYHFNGSYHSNNHEGIVWWLKQQNPKLKILTITTIEQSEVDSIADELDKKLADYIIVVDEDITKTQ